MNTCRLKQHGLGLFGGQAMKHHCNRHSIRELLSIRSERAAARGEDNHRTLRDFLSVLRSGEESFKRGSDLRRADHREES
jgi:hypothetical protein